MRFIPLASSSAGNAYILDDGNTRLLLECGITWKKLQKLAGFSLASLDGCLISHEHNDHSHAAKQVIKAGIPTYLSQGTARALLEGGKLDEDLLGMANEMAAGQQFRIGTMTILPFPTFHDCEEPLGFCIRSDDGTVFAFAIDTVNIPYRFPGVGILAVEANFDPAKFDWLADFIDNEATDLDSVRKRQMRKRMIRTQNTHMSIDTLCECLGRMDLRKCREIWLMHMSDDNGDERRFVEKVKRVVPRTVSVWACPKE